MANLPDIYPHPPPKKQIHRPLIQKPTPLIVPDGLGGAKSSNQIVAERYVESLYGKKKPRSY